MNYKCKEFLSSNINNYQGGRIISEETVPKVSITDSCTEETYQTVRSTIKLQVDMDKLDDIERQRLRQIINRDHRIIKRFLGIIQHNLDGLTKTSTTGNRINISQLWELSLTTKTRTTVRHDIKQEFPRCSTNELQECGRAAVAMVHSFLQLKKKGQQVSFPHATDKLLPRSIPKRAFELKYIEQTKQLVVNLLDSMDDALDVYYNRKSRVHHYPRLSIPLISYPDAITQIQTAQVQELQVVRRNEGPTYSYWIHLTLLHHVPPVVDDHLPQAVIGIDLGIAKLATFVVFAGDKRILTKTLHGQKTMNKLERVGAQIRSLQGELDRRKQTGIPKSGRIDGVVKKLHLLKHRRRDIRQNLDYQLVAQIIHLIEQVLLDKYQLHVVIGDISGIRQAHRRGSGNRIMRDKIHHWSYARFTDQLQHRLELLGLGQRFHKVKEYYSSIRCHRCGRRGLRPRQNLFVCSHEQCKVKKMNADVNAAINIAKKLKV